MGVPSVAVELDRLDDGDLLSVAEMAGLSQLADVTVVDAAQKTASDGVLPDLSDDDLDVLAQLVGQRARWSLREPAKYPGPAPQPRDSLSRFAS